MGEKSGARPKYLVCVRTLALVSGIAGGAGCSSMETGPRGAGGFTGGPIGVSVYDGGFTGTGGYTGGPMGTPPIQDDAGPSDAYDGGMTGVTDVPVTLADGGQNDADGGASGDRDGPGRLRVAKSEAAVPGGAEPMSWMESEARRRLRRAGGIRRKGNDLAFDRAAYSAPALARAERLWTVRQVAEEDSVLIYAEVLLMGARAGISRATRAVLVGMAQDEARHGEICRGVVAALSSGGGTTATRPSAASAPRASARPVEELFLRQLIFGNCMTETLNVSRLVDMTEIATDPFMREALRQLLADEVKHAAFGYQLLEEWRPWLALHPDAVRAIDAFLPRAFCQLERDLSGVGAPSDGYGPEDAALGSPDPAKLAEVFFHTVEEAIVPGLDRFGFAASAAWAARGRQPDSATSAGADGARDAITAARAPRTAPTASRSSGHRRGSRRRRPGPRRSFPATGDTR